MREYLRSGAHARLRRRLEADAKSLYTLYQYGRVQRARVATDAWGWPSILVDDQNYEIPRAEIQLARLPEGVRGAK